MDGRQEKGRREGRRKGTQKQTDEQQTKLFTVLRGEVAKWCFCLFVLLPPCLSVHDEHQTGGGPWDETRRIAYGTTRTGNSQWILQKSIPAPLQQVTDSLRSFWSTRERPEDVNDDAMPGMAPDHLTQSITISLAKQNLLPSILFSEEFSVIFRTFDD